MKTSRRNFIKTSALVGTTLFSNQLFAELLHKPLPKLVGLQLYSVREDMKKNPLDTLKKVAEMGYKNIEHANYNDRKFYGYSATEFTKILADLGLKMPTGHTVLDKKKHWDDAKNDFTDSWKYTVEDAAIGGQKYVISPWLDNEICKNEEELKRMMEIFNKSGELCKKSGMKFGYHNHDFEFNIKLGNKTVYDVILQNTDSKLVMQQLDIGNMQMGGAKAVDILKKYPNRFESMHVKDMIKAEIKPNIINKHELESTILGNGITDVKMVLALGRKIGGTQHFIIEQEEYQDKTPLETAKEDLLVMKKWGY